MVVLLAIFHIYTPALFISASDLRICLCCEEPFCSVWLDGLEIRWFRPFFIKNNGSHHGLLEIQSRTICLLSSLRYVP